MLGNILLLSVFWLLLRLEKKNLEVLGLLPKLERLLQFFLGFLLTAVLAVLLALLFSYIASFWWLPNEAIPDFLLLKGLYSGFNSVLYEELLFRGYLLYKAITLLGDKNANLLSAFAFGVYHWFTLGVIGNPAMMIWVLLYTGLWGMMLAYSYSRTGSLALPIGLHWGWNFIQQVVFNERGGGFFVATTNIHTRYLGNLESMVYLKLPAIAFAVAVIVYLSQKRPHIQQKIAPDAKFNR